MVPAVLTRYLLRPRLLFAHPSRPWGHPRPRPLLFAHPPRSQGHPLRHPLSPPVASGTSSQDRAGVPRICHWIRGARSGREALLYRSLRAAPTTGGLAPLTATSPRSPKARILGSSRPTPPGKRQVLTRPSGDRSLTADPATSPRLMRVRTRNGRAFCPCPGCPPSLVASARGIPRRRPNRTLASRSFCARIGASPWCSDTGASPAPRDDLCRPSSPMSRAPRPLRRVGLWGGVMGWLRAAVFRRRQLGPGDGGIITPALGGGGEGVGSGLHRGGSRSRGDGAIRLPGRWGLSKDVGDSRSRERGGIRMLCHWGLSKEVGGSRPSEN